MKTMTVGEFKTRFAEVLEQVKSGVGFAVTYGRKKEIVGYFLPESQVSKPKRKLGLLEGKAKAIFKPDFKMTEEDLIG
ncbi:type II toxin-antitoxin system Phd/YefM family antitoxin [Parapedobacter tibetensis]|uniref:type II toxin-antitoxin system Phd/YefM family antitoxin n=1 Tax=Parapedobacter tibetensis TaxID=2972951 RepID=UPI00214D7520|nr:prevent-host-death protein [Parapedobacter tibetensis]